jgi:ribonucleoside-diphosphate reductase alpha chain
MLTENAEKVLEARYLQRDENGNIIETPDDMFRRVANTIAEVDLLYDKKEPIDTAEEFYNVMRNLEFLPNSPTLMNAGTDVGLLSACFVLPVEDSIEGIFETIKHTALIHQQGGGTGFSFSRLRPKDDIVMTTKGQASGPVSFMKVFNAATEAIRQGGRRRGASMACLRVDHPDILEFIKCKEDTRELTNFNISVLATQEFMDAVERDRDYPLINPRTGEEVRRLPARKVFDLLCEQAWKTGEPGIVFIDVVNENNPTPDVGSIEATNPCGEQPLLPYESCNLGSINLSAMVKNGAINWGKLQVAVNTAVHFLDNVIDANEYVLPPIEKITKDNRKIGLGVMGFADMLIKLGIPYNSREALKVAEEVMSFIQQRAEEMSCYLASQRGTFPNWEKSTWRKQGIAMRNATITTIAPTGSISIIAGCSSGIEPLFALAFKRNILDGKQLFDVNPLFLEYAEKHGFYSDGLIREVIEAGSIQNVNRIPDKTKRLFATSHDISYEWHVDMQAAFQKYTDNAVSKTINLSYNATVEDVRNAYLRAYRRGCKGITVYRDGSRENQVIQFGNKETRQNLSTLKPRPRPIEVRGTTEKVNIGCGKLYVTINWDDEGVCEVFTATGKAGGCPSQSEATARLISLALRSGVDQQEIIKQLTGIRCLSTVARKATDSEVTVLSCPDAIGKCLDKVINGIKFDNGITVFPYRALSADEIKARYDNVIANACPECGAELEHGSGCVACPQCGFSKCG